MPKLYACMISPDAGRNRQTLVAAARKFAYRIEVLTDGILFDVSGLERLIGKPENVAQAIFDEIKLCNTAASVAVAATPDAAILLARQKGGLCHSIHESEGFAQLPLGDLGLEDNMLSVFDDLGIHRIKDLLAIPRSDLIERYGREFESVLRRIEQSGDRLLVPNVKEENVSWGIDLDRSVENFEQLIFVINHGLSLLFEHTAYLGNSCEHIDLRLTLKNGSTRLYAVKTSFPTLERPLWLKLIDLRVAIAPPDADIAAVHATAHFTKARPEQKGLYAASRPEPESLLLTVNKLKKLVGERNVGVPKLLNSRTAMPFTLDSAAIPKGVNSGAVKKHLPCAAFKYYRPPVHTQVLIREKRLVFVKSRSISGHVVKCSGVWKGNSHWWDKNWRTNEWDIEVEGNGIYRLCKAGDEWFLTGEYD